MGKLNNQDIAAIRECFLKGQVSDYIAKQFGISGQRVRQLTKENEWEALRNSQTPVKANGGARGLALLEAKSADNFRKNNPIVREFILSELAKGVSLNAAAKRVGIDHKTLTQWRQKDPEYDLRCHEAQADFISNVEALACELSSIVGRADVAALLMGLV